MSEACGDISALGQQLFGLENLYRAYRRCRRRKRNTANALRFEQNLEEHLVALHEELTAGTYRPGRAIAFLVEKPKRREIFAADFRDRVVHHVLVGYLEPRWEHRFIHDSYACRTGKGTHKGMERLRSFTRQVTANGTRRAWYLQLDVRGFFTSIDRHILYARLAAKEDDPSVLWLIRVLLFDEPAAHCLLRRARRADFESLPAHKTLFKAAPGCGLPIGNLTSQFFANVYLGHFRHANSQRLIQRLWARFPWLAEYYRLDGARLTWAFRRPRPALRLDQQKAQFSSGLPGHILVVQLGNWCELWGGHPACPLPEAERRFHRNRLPGLRRRLWNSGAPVAWIAETGRRITTINERALVRRWPGVADPRPLSLLTDVSDKECF